MKPASTCSLPVAAAGPLPVRSTSVVRRDRRYRPLPGWMRVVNVVMLPIFYLTSLPGFVLAQAEQTMHDAKVAIVESLKPASPEIKVNRTLPPGVVDDAAAQTAATPSGQNASALFTSDDPKDEEFFKARLFPEPLVPTEAKALPGENKALAAALLAFRPSAAGKPGFAADAVEGLAPITQFLAGHPGSRWSLALWLNLGVTYRKAGYWTRALDAWEHAWAAGKSATSPNARALADRAVAELAELNARLGRFERLGPLFAELDGSGRELRGAAADKLAGARQGLWMMDNQPEISFRCGPMALNCLRLAADPKAGLEPKLFDAKSTRQGISLSQVAALSRDIERPMQMAFRSAGPEGKGPDFLTPAVVHWKAGHYAALVEQRGDRFRVDDPTFGDTTWVTRAALEAETDGYYLVAANLNLPAGWKTVTEAEGNKVWGKGTTGAKDPNCTKCNDQRAKPCASCGGMATYNVEAMLTSLAIGDVPLSYTPPHGESIGFGLNYSQHEASQPAVFTYWNMGQKWTSDWLSYIEDNGTAIWHIDHWDAHYDPNTGITTYTPVWVEIGGCVTGPAPVTHLAGGGMEYYQASDQINNWSYPGIDGDGTSIYFSYASQEQPVAFQFQPIPVYAVNGQVYNPTTNSWVSAYLDPNTYQELYPFLVRPRLVQTGNEQYKRHLPDGTVETYGHSDQATHYPRRIFLTKRTDPSGNTTTFGYDNQNRLIAVTDALGQITTLSYEGADTLKVTKVTDPFGRSCQLSYNDAGQLDTITDTAGIQSFFTYQAGGDFIDSLTTPYGTTTFAFADVTTDPSMGVAAWLEATDPYGDTERAEFRHNAPGIPFSEGIVPQTIPTFNAYINARNTYYWDKKAYKEAKQGDGSFDYTKAKIMHFLHSTDINVCSGTLESTKQPLENRVWLAYQGQTWAGGISNGMSANPSMVARVLDDGSTQLSQYQYNDQWRVTKATDPLGRETTYDYDPANNLDLLTVRCTTGGLNEYLSGATYNAKHQPLTVMDTAGQMTSFTYNDYGQLTSTQDPAGHTVTFQYGGNGYLQEIDGFDPSIKSTFTYDGFGRLASTTAYPDAYTVQVGYEAVGGNPLATLNRPTTATYPDGSYTEVDYTNLDVEWLRDRGGNWTHVLTNKLRQIVATINPLGSVTQYGYCKCGRLVSIVDPNSNVTRWKLDAQERPVAKIYADGTEVDYTYEQTTSQLHTVTDAKGQQTHYVYYLDGALQTVTYANAQVATPGVSYTYDPARGRLVTMVDGIGTTTYSYYPLGNGQPGASSAGRVQSVSGPFSNETVAYQYDPLGRVTTKTVNGVDETYGFDSLGRLQTDINALGTFTYGYDGTTDRLASVGYPNGQQALYSYLEDNTQDRRLSQLKHVAPGGSTLDQFDYGYDGPLGHISHWSQQQPGAASGALMVNAYDLSYDAAGQLTRAVLNGDGSNPGSGVWSYDAAGNRTSIQLGSGTLSTAIPTSTNALFSLSGGGKVRVAGTLDEWAQVQINGQAASPAAGGTNFEAFVPLPIGTQTVTVAATDASGNATTNRYQLTIAAGLSESFAYDRNGNATILALDGGVEQSLEVDALDRVTAITTGSHRSEFGYDGRGARVRITEKENGSVVKDRLYVANEERDASGQVQVTFFAQGEQRAGGNTPGSYFYAHDHLGSLRVLTDQDGAVQASYGYDAWGVRTHLEGNTGAETGFTGYCYHQPSGLELSPTRAYHPGLGRFLSQDSLHEQGGINLYRYCNNDPVDYVDPDGRTVVSWLLTGEWNPDPEVEGQAYDAFADQAGCTARCLASLNKQALAAAAGTLTAGIPIALANIDVSKDLLPEELRPDLAISGLGSGPTSDTTSLLRVISAYTGSYFGMRSSAHLSVQWIANTLKRQGYRGVARVGARGGALGASVAEAALAWYCANKCLECNKAY